MVFLISNKMNRTELDVTALVQMEINLMVSYCEKVVVIVFYTEMPHISYFFV